MDKRSNKLGTGAHQGFRLSQGMIKTTKEENRRILAEINGPRDAKSR